ncbi:MAG TPA: hypothetical protein VIG38_07590 [Hyphomicrobium sp.]|jgi:hypothetical protein
MWASAKNRLVLDYAAIAAKMADRPAKEGSKDRSRIANISAVAAVDTDSWTASDEGASIERLTRGSARFSRAENFDLVKLFPAFKDASGGAKGPKPIVKPAQLRKRVRRTLDRAPLRIGIRTTAR